MWIQYWYSRLSWPALRVVAVEYPSSGIGANTHTTRNGDHGWRSAVDRL